MTTWSEIFDTHVYETAETEGHYAFKKYSKCARPCPWGPNAAGILHYIGDWDTREVPQEQDHQSFPIRTLRKVISGRSIQAKGDANMINDLKYSRK